MTKGGNVNDFLEVLKERVIVYDGPMGASIQKHDRRRASG